MLAVIANHGAFVRNDAHPAVWTIALPSIKAPYKEYNKNQEY
jgi:hypothetical protein